jgi:hypothetical protein
MQSDPYSHETTYFARPYPGTVGSTYVLTKQAAELLVVVQTAAKLEIVQVTGGEHNGQYCAVNASGQAILLDVDIANAALELKQHQSLAHVTAQTLKSIFADAFMDKTLCRFVWTGTGDIKEGDIVEVSLDPENSNDYITLFAEAGSTAAGALWDGIEAFCGLGSDGLLGALGTSLCGIYKKVNGHVLNGSAVYRHVSHLEHQAPSDSDKYIWRSSTEKDAYFCVGWHKNMEDPEKQATCYMMLPPVTNSSLTVSTFNPEALESEGSKWRMYSAEKDALAPLLGLHAISGNFEYRTVKQVERDSAGQPIALQLDSTVRDASADAAVPADLGSTLGSMGYDAEHIQVSI